MSSHEINYKESLFGGLVLVAFFILSFLFVSWGEEGGDVGRFVETSPPNVESRGAATDMVLGRPMDLNALTVEELKLIPGVGEKTAQRIYDKGREKGGFKSVDELHEVDGLGDKKIGNIKKYVEIK